MPRAPQKLEARRGDDDVVMETGTAVTAAADPEEVAKGEQPEARPLLPKFAPLSAYEQNGKKLEFRRVCAAVIMSHTVPSPCTQIQYPRAHLSQLCIVVADLYCSTVAQLSVVLILPLRCCHDGVPGSSAATSSDTPSGKLDEALPACHRALAT